VKLVLERFGFGRDSTLGELSVDGKPTCFVIEDERRITKRAGETCIPVGTYPLTIRAEGRFHIPYARRFPAFHIGVLTVENVPGFEGIRIHCGNGDDDTDGCLLPVTTAIVLPNGEFAGSESARAYEKLYRRIVERPGFGDDPVTITIREREAA
jgi:hypothetical protein